MLGPNVEMGLRTAALWAGAMQRTLSMMRPPMLGPTMMPRLKDAMSPPNAGPRAAGDSTSASSARLIETDETQPWECAWVMGNRGGGGVVDRARVHACYEQPRSPPPAHPLLATHTLCPPPRSKPAHLQRLGGVVKQQRKPTVDVQQQHRDRRRSQQDRRRHVRLAAVGVAEVAHQRHLAPVGNGKQRGQRQINSWLGVVCGALIKVLANSTSTPPFCWNTPERTMTQDSRLLLTNAVQLLQLTTSLCASWWRCACARAAL